MPKINRERLKRFIAHRRRNMLGLLIITAFSLIATVLYCIKGVSRLRARVLICVTVALILLCALQAFKLLHGFRTLRNTRGIRVKRRKSSKASDKEN